MTKKNAVALTSALSGALYFQICQYDILNLWIALSIVPHAIAKKIAILPYIYIEIIKPFSVFALGAYAGALFLWFRFRNGETFNPFLVSLGCLLGVAVAAILSPGLSFFAALLLFIFPGSLILITPPAFQPLLISFGMFLAAWFFPFLFAFLGGTIAFRKSSALSKAISSRLLFVLAVLLFIIPLLPPVSGKEFLLRKSPYESILHDKKFIAAFKGEGRHVINLKDKDKILKLQKEMENAGIKTEVEDYNRRSWIISVHENQLSHAKLIANPNLLTEMIAKHEQVLKDQLEKGKPYEWESWKLIRFYEDLGRYDDALKILEDLKRSGLIGEKTFRNSGNYNRYVDTRSRLQIKKQGGYLAIIKKFIKDRI